VLNLAGVMKLEGAAAVICATPAVVPGVNWGVWLGLDEPAGKVNGEFTVPALVLSEFKDTDSVRSLGAIGAKAPKLEILELFGSNWTNETPKCTAAPPMDAVNEGPPSDAESSTPDGVTITVALSEP